MYTTAVGNTRDDDFGGYRLFLEAQFGSRHGIVFTLVSIDFIPVASVVVVLVSTILHLIVSH